MASNFHFYFLGFLVHFRDFTLNLQNLTADVKVHQFLEHVDFLFLNVSRRLLRVLSLTPKVSSLTCTISSGALPARI